MAALHSPASSQKLKDSVDQPSHQCDHVSRHSQCGRGSAEYTSAGKEG